MKGRSDWKNPPQVPYKINKTKRKRHSYPSHYPNNVVLTWKLEHGRCHKIIIYLNVFPKGRYWKSCLEVEWDRPYIRWRKGKYPYPTTITEIRPCLVKCFWAHNYYLCFSFYFQSMCRYRTLSFFNTVCADIGTFGNFSWPRESPALLVDFIVLPPTKDFIVSHA